MDVDWFWSIIDSAPHEDALRALLEPLDRDDLADFAGLLEAFWFRAEREDVWGAGYTLDGGMSDSSFMDFRSWLIGRGRAAYEAVLVNPDALADAVPGLVVGESHTDEGFGSIASELYEDRYGEEPPDRDYGEEVAASLPAAEHARREHPIAGEDWEGDEQRRYPRLLALIAEQHPPAAGTLLERWGTTENDDDVARFIFGLLKADWPDGVQPSGGAWVSDDPHVGGVTLCVGAGFEGHEIGDLRAEYDGHRVRVGWPAGRHWTDGTRPLAAGGAAAIAELEPEAAVAFAFDALITQLRREVAHLVWLGGAGVIVHLRCLHVDDGTGGWSSDLEHRSVPPRRPPDRIIRYRPVT